MMSAESANDATPVAKPGSRWTWVFYVAVGLALVAAVRFLPLQELLKQGLDRVGTLGPWAPALYIAMYIVATVFMIPGSFLTLGAGAVFGLAQGIFLASIAATLAATCSFLVGRHLARDALTRRMEGNEKFIAIDQAVATEGWKIVFLTRLSPVFPYTLLNYIFGLTRVKLGHYVLASWIGMLPGTVLFVYLGSLAREAAHERTPVEWGLYGVGLLATVAVTIFVTQIARRALAGKISP
jgi:uncharacterized membrane protein YdjX (TVP38/TMEM64 family)